MLACSPELTILRSGLDCIWRGVNQNDSDWLMLSGGQSPTPHLHILFAVTDDGRAGICRHDSCKYWLVRYFTQDGLLLKLKRWERITLYNALYYRLVWCNRTREAYVECHTGMSQIWKIEARFQSNMLIWNGMLCRVLRYCYRSAPVSKLLDHVRS